MMAGRPTAGIERIERLAAENGRLRAVKEAQEAIEKHSLANGVESPEGEWGSPPFSPGRTSLLLPDRRIVRDCRRVSHRSRPMSFRPLAS